MKNILLYILPLFILASCSQSRYGQVPKVKREQIKATASPKHNITNKEKQMAQSEQKPIETYIDTSIEATYENKLKVKTIVPILYVKQKKKLLFDRETKSIKLVPSKHVNYQRQLSPPPQETTLDKIIDASVFVLWYISLALIAGGIVYLFIFTVPFITGLLVFLGLILFFLLASFVLFGRLMRNFSYMKPSDSYKDSDENRKKVDVKSILIYCGWVLGTLLFIGYIVYLFFVPVPVLQAVLILLLLLLLFVFFTAWLFWEV